MKTKPRVRSDRDNLEISAAIKLFAQTQLAASTEYTTLLSHVFEHYKAWALAGKRTACGRARLFNELRDLGYSPKQAKKGPVISADLVNWEDPLHSVQAFCEHYCERARTGLVPVSDLYERYEKWATDVAHLRPVSRPNFDKQMNLMDLSSRLEGGFRVYPVRLLTFNDRVWLERTMAGAASLRAVMNIAQQAKRRGISQVAIDQAVTAAKAALSPHQHTEAEKRVLRAILSMPYASMISATQRPGFAIRKDGLVDRRVPIDAEQMAGYLEALLVVLRDVSANQDKLVLELNELRAQRKAVGEFIASAMCDANVIERVENKKT